MKHTRRIASLLLALVMVFAMAISVSAATITVNGQEGETYTAYKIFDVTYSGNQDSEGNYEAYSYTIASNSEWYDTVVNYAPTSDSGLTLTAASTTDGVTTYNVSTTNVFNPATFANILKLYVANKTPSGSKTVTANADEDTAGSADIEVSGGAGYYFVTTSLGSLCILNTADDTVIVNEKNGVPTIEKEVKEGNNWQETSDGDIGDIVEYKTTIDAKKGTVNYVLHDKMDAGLSFNAGSIVVKRTVGTTETTLAAGTDYTVTTSDLTDGCTFEIALTKLNNAAEDSTVVVTYNATINANAVIGYSTNGDGNTNETYLKYGNAGETTHEKTETYVWEFDVLKYTGTTTKTPLSGAKFSLYTEEACTTALKFTKAADSEVFKLDATGTVTEITTTNTGTFQIEGLESGDYWLKEIEAPAGYNKLTAPIKVTIAKTTADNSTEITGATISYTVDVTTTTATNNTVEVLNQTGSTLPSTGGMGTTLFYVVGGLMVLAAVVLLVTKKRMAAAE